MLQETAQFCKGSSILSNLNNIAFHFQNILQYPVTIVSPEGTFRTTEQDFGLVIYYSYNTMAEFKSDIENLDSEITTDFLEQTILESTMENTDSKNETLQGMPDFSFDFNTDLLDMPDLTNEFAPAALDYVPITPKPYIDFHQIPGVSSGKEKKTFLSEQGTYSKNITSEEKSSEQGDRSKTITSTEKPSGQGAYSKNITLCTPNENLGNTKLSSTHYSRFLPSGQGAHTKDISRCSASVDDVTVENKDNSDEGLITVPEVMMNVELVQPPMEYASVLALEEEMEEEMHELSEESALNINAEFDKVTNELASSYGLRGGARNKKFYRRSLLAISKKEKESLLRLSDKSITKARREEMIRLCERNLQCVKMYELLTLRIQSFLIKPFRFFTENL